VDLAGKEEDESDCDLPVAYLPRDGKISLLQFDGSLPKKDIKELIKLATKACEEIHKLQQEALMKRWMK